jgi:hypothetical protein
VYNFQGKAGFLSEKLRHFYCGLTKNDISLDKVRESVYNKRCIFFSGGVFVVEYMTTQEVATLWGVTKRRIQAMCDKGRISNAARLGLIWVIPKGTPKPPDGRTRAVRNSGR